MNGKAVVSMVIVVSMVLVGLIAGLGTTGPGAKTPERSSGLTTATTGFVATSFDGCDTCEVANTSAGKGLTTVAANDYILIDTTTYNSANRTLTITDNLGTKFRWISGDQAAEAEVYNEVYWGITTAASATYWVQATDALSGEMSIVYVAYSGVGKIATVGSWVNCAGTSCGPMTVAGTSTGNVLALAGGWERTTGAVTLAPASYTNACATGCTVATSSFPEIWYWANIGSGTVTRFVNETQTTSNKMELSLIDLTPATAPPAPTGLSGSSKATTNISWTWAQATGGYITDDYLYLYSGTGCSGAPTTENLGAPGTAYTTTGLTTHSWYSATVAAANLTGTGAPSSCVNVLTVSVAPAPTALTAAIINTTDVFWTWTQATGGGVTDDQLSFYTGSGCGGTPVTFDLGAASVHYDLKPLTSGVAYSATVSAENATGWGVASACVNVATASLPAAPAGLMVTAITTTGLTWSWTNPSTGGLTDTHLYLYAGGTCSGAPTSDDIGSVAVTYAVGSLLTGTPYSAEVSVSNATGVGAYSACSTGTTFNSASSPPPTAVSVGSATTTSLTVSWTNPAGALTADEVAYTSVIACLGVLTVLTYGVVTAETVGSLSPATTYYFEVAASTSGGYGPYSACTSGATLPTVPAAPTGLTVTGVTQTTVGLAWVAGLGTTANQTVWRGTTCGAYTVGLSVGASWNTTVVTGLAVNATYAFAVQGWGALGGGPLSGCVLAHTFGPAVISKTTWVNTTYWDNTTKNYYSWSNSTTNYWDNTTLVHNYWTNTTLKYWTNTTNQYWTNTTFDHWDNTTLVHNYWFNSTLVYWDNTTAYHYVTYYDNLTRYDNTTTWVNTTITLNLDAAIVTAAALNTTAITVSWRAVPGHVTNYTLSYARFPWLAIASFSVGNTTIFNVTDLAPGLTYYFVVWAWFGGHLEGPPSNVAPAQTDPSPVTVPPFPWLSLEAITTLSILGSAAFSAVVASLVSGRRSRRAEGAASVALARSRPRRATDEGHWVPTTDQGAYRSRPYVAPGRGRR